ncbi:MAG: DUF4262 domain-containing protein [Acidimicrobiales bacterium]
MCRICDGYSDEELTRELDLAIRVHGFTRVGVENPDGTGWTYTIGLAENCGQPDLVCIDVEPDFQQRLVQAIAATVVETGSPPDARSLAQLDVELVQVHPRHLDGDLVNLWAERYRRRPGEGDFLQVLPGSSHFCACHARAARRLDDPRPVTTPGPNRAQRRARDRNSGRHGRPPR